MKCFDEVCGDFLISDELRKVNGLVYNEDKCFGILLFVACNYMQ